MQDDDAVVWINLIHQETQSFLGELDDGICLIQDEDDSFRVNRRQPTGRICPGKQQTLSLIDRHTPRCQLWSGTKVIPPMVFIAKGGLREEALATPLIPTHVNNERPLPQSTAKSRHTQGANNGGRTGEIPANRQNRQ